MDAEEKKGLLGELHVLTEKLNQDVDRAVKLGNRLYGEGAPMIEEAVQRLAEARGKLIQARSLALNALQDADQPAGQPDAAGQP